MVQSARVQQPNVLAVPVLNHTTTNNKNEKCFDAIGFHYKYGFSEPLVIKLEILERLA